VILAGRLDLIGLRASQINGWAPAPCSTRRSPASTARPTTASSRWSPGRDAPFFTDAERAALALTEAVTRLADTADPVPDSVWEEAARHYDEQELAALVLAIATVNVWNRLNVATRQLAGQER
jgi:alkylhydroperoxidase family enzyme